jgi:hypothetical protein
MDQKRRLSSIFSLSKSHSTSNLSASSGDSHPHDRDSSQERAGRLQQQKPHKLRITSDGSSPPPESILKGLDPPHFPGTRSASNPPSSYGSRPGSRVGSPMMDSRDGSRSRPQTPVYSAPGLIAQSPSRPGTPSSAKPNKRRSWMPGSSGKSEVAPIESVQYEPNAWIAGLREHIPYDLMPLLNGTRVR